MQGEYIYSAQNDPPEGPDLTSDMALTNPRHRQVVIVPGFLHDPALAGTITDTHFVTRNRMGRLLVFMAHILAEDHLSSVKAIGIDEQTAVLLDPHGQSSIIGHGAAYFLSSDDKNVVLKEGTPLSMKSVQAKKVLPGGRFDLHTWSGDATEYKLNVESGVIHSSQANGAIY